MGSHFVLGRRSFVAWVAAAGGGAVVGCSADDERGDGAPAAREPVLLPALGTVVLTTERRLVPARARGAEATTLDPRVPSDLAALLADGFGDYSYGAGEAVRVRTWDGAEAPASGATPKLLARFVHVTDIHVTDDESPARLEAYDGPVLTDGASRPQAAYMGRMLNAAVRTINALHRDAPIDFVLLGGDSTDSAQRNELTWVVQILSGSGSVTCDSGVSNDPEPGSNNDSKDPFLAEGLAMPWRFCLGNHDTEVMGISAIAPANIARATGVEAKSGTRDYGQPGAPVVKGEVPPDEERRPLVRAEMLPLIAADGDGHGLAALSTDKASYVFDIEGTVLRFVVYDTAFEGGGAEGVVRQADVDAFLRPALDQAKADGKLVVLTAHHGLGSLREGSASGSEVEEMLLPEDVRALFLSYDNIVMSLTGHTHRNVVRWVGEGAAGFWEVQTSSLVEFPQQMRVVEISDEDNGHLSIQLVGLEFATEGDDVAEIGRTLAILDHTAGWGAGSEGSLEDRNVKLYVPKAAS